MNRAPTYPEIRRVIIHDTSDLKSINIKSTTMLRVKINGVWNKILITLNSRNQICPLMGQDRIERENMIVADSIHRMAYNLMLHHEEAKEWIVDEDQTEEKERKF